MLRLKCDQCGKRLKVSPEWAGNKVRCLGCGNVLVVPGEKFQRGSPKPDESAAADQPLIPRTSVMAEGEGIDMTAMVDIVFFLLIFFLVTSMHSLQASMEVPDARASSGEGDQQSKASVEQDPDQVTIRIDRDDTVWVEDAEAPSYQEILSRLRDLTSDRPAGSRPELLVIVSGEAHHGTVVTALDAGSEAGMDRLQLAMDDEL